MQHLQPNTTLQGGKYRIERVLGQGGFGITYLAEQVSLKRKVAIKELFIGGEGQAINDRRGNQVVVSNSANQVSFDQQKAKFKKEALRLADLSHPNLAKVHEFFEENGTTYIVMDYIDGESLRTKLKREGPLSESVVISYLKQVLAALEVAHKQNIWHLDIKPENIMVDKSGRVYLIDFGASKHIDSKNTLTTTLSLAYTPGYCAPELLDLSNESPENYIQALKDIGPWTDIYSLGATMYNLLTDSIPPSRRRLENDGCNAFMFPSNVSSSTKDLIIRMMKPNKDERPKSVAIIGDRQTEEVTLNPKSLADLEREAIAYYQKNDIKILNQYGFFNQKKKRQASTIWASCIICFILSMIIGAIIIEYLGMDHFGPGGFFIYLLVFVFGLYPGLTVGPAILGFNDKRQFDDLAENIKKQFIKDYIKEHNK